MANEGKTRVMLWLDDEDAVKLRTLAAAAGCRGVSEYIVEFILAQQNVSITAPAPAGEESNG